MPAVELAIPAQRETVGFAITLGYCLHLWSRWEIENSSAFESDEPVEDSIERADKTHLTSMLLVSLHSVHRGLDPVGIRRANADPSSVKGAPKSGGSKKGDDA
jgi:hypothetical protein